MVCRGNSIFKTGRDKSERKGPSEEGNFVLLWGGKNGASRGGGSVGYDIFQKRHQDHRTRDHRSGCVLVISEGLGAGGSRLKKSRRKGEDAVVSA